jgi:hypothetical protein
MAIPGDNECRPVMPCAPGTWGDIRTDATTEHVDGSYAGADGDGSSAKPWTTIASAIAAAEPGAIVAIAAGSYGEDLDLQGKPVVVWGKCPNDVEIVGSASAIAAIVIRGQADGTILRGVAVTGAATGIGLSGSERVAIDRVWVHDTSGRGLSAENVLGPTSLALTSSLIERTHEIGVHISGAVATVETTVVRETMANASDDLGRGINVQVGGGESSAVAIRTSVVESNNEVGVYVGGSQVAIDASVVRGTLPNARGKGGRGVYAGVDGQEPSDLTVRGSLVDDNQEVGLFVEGSALLLESTVVRGTRLDDAGLFGRGVGIQNASTATIRSSLVDGNRDFGVFVMASQATLEASVVRATLPRGDGLYGAGIDVQFDIDTGARSTATIRGSVIEQNHEHGIIVLSSDANVEGCLVRATKPNGAGLFGDGLCAFAEVDDASTTVTASRIEDSARAGVSSFGALVSLGDTAIACSAFDLAAASYDERPFSFEDRGGNACGCPPAANTCSLTSADLQPPVPATPVQ